MEKFETIVFGGGCFWCTEAIFQRLRGVQSVTSGYAGGQMPDPTYDQVSSGATGHAEVIKIEFDPNVISLDDLMSVFFSTHDPTTPDRQGADVGSQYRSVIFYTKSEQADKAQKFVDRLEDEKVFDHAIVTEIKPLGEFFTAEEYHQNFYNQNKSKPYCQVVINPKLEKLKKQYARFYQGNKD